MAPGKASSLSKAKAALSAAASFAASVVLLRTVVDDLLPWEIRDYFYSGVYTALGYFSSEFTVVIDEAEGFFGNELFEAARVYLSGRTSRSTRRVRASKQEDENNIIISVEPGEEVVDLFDGVRFRWRLVTRQGKNRSTSDNGGSPLETSAFELTFDRKHKDKALGAYLHHVVTRYREKKAEDQTIHIHMLNYGSWSAVKLDHPSTFDTLAMEPEMKQMLMEDLRKFQASRDQYRRAGRAWKRGYLLYGPPGTGKSSLIGAMANFLRFDIYDLELTEVDRNTTLRELLAATANRSIIVFEDVDCTIDACTKNRESGEDAAAEPQNGGDKITLSGLLNFIDGLWSTCGQERIIVFTTNHPERIDPALLRPGRMDMHIHMGYCGPSGFRTLASNYHGVETHPLFGEVEELIRQVEVTPAEVAGELMKSGQAENALLGLINFLTEKKKRTTTTTTGEKEEAAEIDVVLDLTVGNIGDD